MIWKMKCPYCNYIFTINQKQMDWNTRFKCPKCLKLNEGSSSSGKDGVLIGVTKEDYRASEIKILKENEDDITL